MHSRLQLCTFMPFWIPWKREFSSENDGKRKQVRTTEDKHPKPPSDSPPLDFPDRVLQELKKLGQKSCRTKVSRIFRIFVPNFAPNFPRIFRGLFVLRFVGDDGDQKKFTKNPHHFSMPNSQANTKKIFTKCFWRAGRVRKSWKSPRITF